MADVLSGVALRAVDSNDDVKQIGVWGATATVDLEDLKAYLDAGTAVHGLKSVGKIERYIDNAVDMAGFQVPAGKNIVTGDLIISRVDAGPVYFSGKFPDNNDDLGLICQALIEGNKLVGEKAIAEVNPSVRTGKRFIK